MRDADTVVGKIVVHLWDINLWHVTRRAVLCAYWTSWSGMVRGFFGARGVYMATQTRAIVRSSVRLELFVGIVASDAR